MCVTGGGMLPRQRRTMICAFLFFSPPFLSYNDGGGCGDDDDDDTFLLFSRRLLQFQQAKRIVVQIKPATDLPSVTRANQFNRALQPVLASCLNWTDLPRTPISKHWWTQLINDPSANIWLTRMNTTPKMRIWTKSVHHPQPMDPPRTHPTRTNPIPNQRFPTRNYSTRTTTPSANQRRNLSPKRQPCWIRTLKPTALNPRRVRANEVNVWRRMATIRMVHRSRPNRRRTIVEVSEQIQDRIMMKNPTKNITIIRP